MRIVIALGGHSLLWRSAPMTAEVQRRNARVAAQAIAPLAARHSIVVVHGNGPQVSPLALQAESYPGAEPYPVDVLDAGTQGMIGYLIQKELRNLLPQQTPVATVLTMITVDPDDPAFACPSTFVGPVYHRDAADMLAAKRGWAFRRDGTAWRRVVPSPEPRQILEIKPITWLLDHGAVVICACGGGIPAVHPTSAPGVPAAAEAVIDQDRASEMLAEDVGADLFLMATDVDGGPKMEAAVRFATKTGKRAAIGSLADIGGIVAGIAGTNVITRPGRRRQVRAASVGSVPAEAVPGESGGAQSAPVSARNAATAASTVGKK